MAFTYDLESPDAAVLLLSEIRLELGDTQFNAGVKPDGSNFTDEEIQYMLTKESNDTVLTVVRACRMLSRLWTNVANTTVGPRKDEFGKIAGEWDARASTALASIPAGNDTNYRIRIRKMDHIHDPYQVRDNEDRTL